MLNKFVLLLVLQLLLLPIALHAQKYELWGMTTGGQGGGAIFKTDSIGENMELVYRFVNYGGRPKNTHFVQYSNNKLYAVASGGNYGSGVIFEFDINTNTYIKKFDFKQEISGKEPVGGLCLASNGKLYGMCRFGGQNNYGVIYEYNPLLDSFKVVFNFNATGSGFSPRGGLIQASNGKLYGLTTIGYSGTLFEFDISTNTFTKKVTFAGIGSLLPNKGAYPIGDLVQAPNGKLYGMTQYGGSNANNGVIFEYDIVQDTLLVKYSFGINERPRSTLVLLSSGKMYGFNSDRIFEFNYQNGQFAYKYQFTSQNYNNGFSPVDRLVKTSNGKLLGFCNYGGVNNLGVLFEFNPITFTYTKKKDLTAIIGSKPEGRLFLANNGLFYAAIPGGGMGEGTIVEYNYSSNVLVKKHDFVSAPDGNKPYGSLLLATNDKFYGMTSYGGQYNYGVLFEFDPKTEVFTKKFDFTTNTDIHPMGSLMQASNGKLYGMVKGQYSEGSFFEYDIQTDSLSVKQYFGAGLFGGAPFGGLVEDDSMNLYGMTSDYLGHNGGIFEYDINTGTLYPRYGFSSFSMARRPEGTMIKVNSAMLMGLAKHGGANGKGGIFSYYTTSKTTALLFSFNGSNGANPTGDLLKASNGKFYGLTSSGGANNCGVLFEFNGLFYNKKFDFVDSLGVSPHGSLMQAANGKFYGLTYSGGAFNKGVLFEYDPLTSQYSVRHNFNGQFGANPYYTTLVERDACAYATYSSISEISCNKYISPSGKIWTQTGIYIDTVSNRYYCDSIITINLIVSHVDTTVSVSGATLSANFNGGVYQWLDCDNAYAPISGATAQSYTPSTNGHYAVMLAGNGCIDTSYCYAINTVGIVENTFGNLLQAFPNPTSGDFRIDLGKEYQEVQLWLRDATGHLVNHTVYRNSSLIDFRIDSPAGLYFLELRNSERDRVLIKIMKL